MTPLKPAQHLSRPSNGSLSALFSGCLGQIDSRKLASWSCKLRGTPEGNTQAWPEHRNPSPTYNRRMQDETPGKQRIQESKKDPADHNNTPSNLDFLPEKKHKNKTQNTNPNPTTHKKHKILPDKEKTLTQRSNTTQPQILRVRFRSRAALGIAMGAMATSGAGALALAAAGARSPAAGAAGAAGAARSAWSFCHEGFVWGLYH